MSGHSHWAGIKHKKGIKDAQRAKVFTKHGKLIAIAAKEGGGDPEKNWKLRLVVERAKADNMPKENIERAIKRGTGEFKGEEISEIIYEAMGPRGVMMIIKTATDNRNRTVNEIKGILAKAKGKLGEVGSIMWNFKKVGAIVIIVPQKEDLYSMEMRAIEAGAEDTERAENYLIVYTKTENLQKVKDNLEKANLPIESVEIMYLPNQKVSLSTQDGVDYEKLLQALYEQEDVQEIYDNL